MNEPIISREQIRERARCAFAAGKSRDEHDMNPGSAAIADWEAGWDRAYADWAHPEEATS